jgi:O-methyltransferase
MAALSFPTRHCLIIQSFSRYLEHEKITGQTYLDLVKKSVSGYLYFGENVPFTEFAPLSHDRYQDGAWTIPRQSQPHSLLTKGQLDLIEDLILRIEKQGVVGDLIEAGVWRGGAGVYKRAVLAAYTIEDRQVFLADSFEGIPVNKNMSGDPVDLWQDRWVAPFEEVEATFSRYGLLDQRVTFVRGYFKETLPLAPISKLSLIRLDADSYESTMEALIHLYPKLSNGGAVIIDDWHLPGCRLAVNQYRKDQNILAPIINHPANEFWIKD